MGIIKIFKKIFIAFSLVFPTFVVCCNSRNQNQVRILSVHDGDTFTDSSKVIYRLFGVDTPEISNQFKGFSTTAGIEQLYAQNALQATKDLIENKVVTIEEKAIDAYERHVVKINVGNLDLGFYLVRNGLARVAYFDVVNSKSPYYSTDYSYYSLLVHAQRKAFEDHLGVWRDLNEFKTIFPKA